MTSRINPGSSAPQPGQAVSYSPHIQISGPFVVSDTISSAADESYSCGSCWECVVDGFWTCISAVVDFFAPYFTATSEGDQIDQYGQRMLDPSLSEVERLIAVRCLIGYFHAQEVEGLATIEQGERVTSAVTTFLNSIKGTDLEGRMKEESKQYGEGDDLGNMRILNKVAFGMIVAINRR